MANCTNEALAWLGEEDVCRVAHCLNLILFYDAVWFTTTNNNLLFLNGDGSVEWKNGTTNTNANRTNDLSKPEQIKGQTKNQAALRVVLGEQEFCLSFAS